MDNQKKSLDDLLNDIVRKKRKISQSRESNLRHGHRGQVRVDRIVHKYSRDTNKAFPSHDGFKNINVCSTTDQLEFKGLSPFLLGPVDHDDPFFPPAINLENFWHWTKVYKQDVDGFGNPSAGYFEKRRQWFNSTKANMRNNRVKKDFLYSYHDGKRYTYLEARRDLYCGTYTKLVIGTNSYKKLVQLLNEGTNIQLLGYDGIDYHPEDDPSGEVLYQHFLNPIQSFGHELVIVGLLTNKKVWEWYSE